MSEKEEIKETKEEKAIPEDKIKDEIEIEEKPAEEKKGKVEPEKRAPYVRLTREEREKKEIEKTLEEWKPKTVLGKQVRDKKIKNIDEILDKKILEEQIIDSLLSLETELLSVGQAKGKFGGGKRRAWKQTQKKTMEGNIPSFSSSVIVGDKKGHIGLGSGKAKETLPARSKALRKAKLNLIKITRGCGSFDCLCDEPHSIPFMVKGKCGSSVIVLYPAPQGTGLVIGDECKRILKLAGIKDVYSKTFGQTRTTKNLAKACIEALKKTNLKQK